MSISISHLEKLYIENRDYIDSLSSDGIKALISTPLYRTILGNIFETHIKNGEISEEDYYSMKSNCKVLDMIDYYFEEKGIRVKETAEIEKSADIEGILEFQLYSPLRYYINNIPKKLLTPREERYLFKKLKNEEAKLKKLKTIVLERKKKYLEDLVLQYSDTVSYSKMLEYLNNYMFDNIEKYKGIVSFDSYFEKEAEIFARKVFNSIEFRTNFPATPKDKELIKHIGVSKNESIDEIGLPIIEEKEKYDEVFKKIANANLRLVIWTIKRMGLMSNSESIEDTIQDGNEGLLRAIRAFNLDKNCAFATYALFWIKKAIIENNANNQRFKIPKSKLNLGTKIVAYMDAYRFEHGIHPTIKEIAENFGIKESTARQLLIFNQETVSLDSKVDSEDEDERLLGEIIEDETQNVEESIFVKELQSSVDKELKKIDPKIRLILMLRLGLVAREPELLISKKNRVLINSNELNKEEMIELFDKFGLTYNFTEGEDYNNGEFHVIDENTSYIFLNGEERTLQDLGKIFGVKHQRISKLEREGITALKLPIHSNKLKDFYE